MNSTRALPALVIGFIIIALTQMAHAAQPPDLIAAVKSGDSAAVKRLLQSPEQVNARDARGNTALHWRWRATTGSWRNCSRRVSTRASPTTPVQLRFIMPSETNAS